MSKRGVVACGHRVTADAACEILAAGGNAFDAAIGGFFAACVAEPVLTSIGGGGFMTVRSAAGDHLAYDFFAHTPRHKLAEADCDFQPIVADFGVATQEFHIGLGSAATPGAVLGMFELHADFGHMPMREILAPAIQSARAGVEITPFQSYLFSVISPIYRATAEARAAFSTVDSDELLVRPGDRLAAPELADLLEGLGGEGADLFYRGEIAARIDDQCRDAGGHLRREDFENYRVHRRKPLELEYRDARVALNPPPSSGGVLIAFGLKLLEELDLTGLRPDSLRWKRMLVELLSQTQLARVDAAARGAVDDSAMLDPGFLGVYRKAVLGRWKALRGTTHLNVLDAAGNVAAMTVSNGEGCGHLVPGAGFMLNNMLGEEDLHPAGFHRWEPDQRLTSMMCPTLVFRRDGSLLALGSGGSNRIRTAILQVLVNVLDFGMALEPAVEQPRVHFENDFLHVEGGGDEARARDLAAGFEHQQLWPERNLFFGGVHAVALSPAGFSGAADPRRDGVLSLI